MMKNGTFKLETEALLVTVQDQALKTRRSALQIHFKTTNTEYAKPQPETPSHIVSACPDLTKEECIRRRDRVSQFLYYKISKEMRVPELTSKWYGHVPEPVQDRTSHQTWSFYKRSKPVWPTVQQMLLRHAI